MEIDTYHFLSDRIGLRRTIKNAKEILVIGAHYFDWSVLILAEALHLIDARGSSFQPAGLSPTMVVTRSGAARVERDRRERYTYAPRSQPLLTDTIGNKYIDSYLEYDCLMTPEELKRLADHKYSAVDTSWLDELCMKYFWEWAVEFYPLWLAPNLITLIGLIVNLITVLVLSHYCPTAREVAPSWAYALAALGLFTYQTLDATGEPNTGTEETICNL
ncbi:hypothetical protein Y032_0046g1334 [Ancylostoma ceylanicum]|uniref:Uncharacterized protein n=2 Tax=Ancylostoma ceylanicum TaxID=53326 RepID=A0A016UCR8_9BILA|nr:hypothetical protein Y032_0046g1334 [Ancylostoma ceylanicum]